MLENFEENYFYYLYDKYKYFIGYTRIIDFEETAKTMLNSEEEITEEEFIKLNNHIAYLKKKLSSDSYKSAYVIINDKNYDLLKEIKNLSEIKLKKNEAISDVREKINEHLELILEIIKYLKKEEVKKHLIVKDLSYTIIKYFWQDKAFLLKTNAKNDAYIIFKNFFMDSISAYLLEDKSKAKCRCIACDGPLKNASDSTTLTFLQHIGADGGKKPSHFWDMNRDDYTCPICNLVYACVPLGFTFLRGKGLFINNNSSVESLVDTNKHTLDKTCKIQDLEYSSYFKIATMLEHANMAHSDKELKNIQVIKYDESNPFNKYTFNMLPVNMLRIISKNINRFKFLMTENIPIYEKSDENGTKVNSYLNLFSAVIDKLYKNENLFSLIALCLNVAIRNGQQDMNKIEVLLKINNQILAGGNMAILSDKKIYRIACLGNSLKESLIARGAENKIDSITYKLTNALRLKNTNEFMDTIIIYYAYLDKDIPSDLLDCLKNKNLLQEIGYAFTMGLRGEGYGEQQ